MTVVWLAIELYLHVMEDGWFEIVATAAALICATLASALGVKTGLAAMAWFRSRVMVWRGLILVSEPCPNWRIWAEFVLWLQLVATPPWLFSASYGDFFFYWVHALALAAASVSVLNRRMPRLNEASQP